MGFKSAVTFLRILVGYIPGRITNLVDNALLNLGLRIAGGDRLRKAGEVIHTGNEDVRMSWTPRFRRFNFHLPKSPVYGLNQMFEVVILV